MTVVVSNLALVSNVPGTNTTGNNDSYTSTAGGGHQISADGRFIAFISNASNLVSGDTNGATDVFVKDMQTGIVSRVSTTTNGTQATNNSYNPAISANGQFVAFWSDASDLVPGDTNNRSDIFVKNLASGEIRRVSTAADGTQANRASNNVSISADGRYVAFSSAASNLGTGDTPLPSYDVFVKDLQTGIVERISSAPDGSEGNSDSYEPSISADGRFVAFRSNAWNLVPGDSNNLADIFVKDRLTGTLTRVNVPMSGGEANAASADISISSDGRYVVFDSIASNLVPGDTNGRHDVFVKDLVSGALTRVSTSADGTQGSGPNYYAAAPSISPDGRYVAFQSSSSNFAPGQTGYDSVYVKDLQTGAIALVSAKPDGNVAQGWSGTPSISLDGHVVAFISSALNLGAVNGNLSYYHYDVYAVDLTSGPLALLGTDGDDTFSIASGELTAGASIDGRAGRDTLQLLAGPHSLVGVALSNVESITLANSTLTLGSAAQAGLVTAATGGNDTVIYDGYLDWATQALWLGQHGVENVRFTNGNGTNTMHFDAGVLASLDIVYDASNTTFETTTNTYDPSGALASQHSVYDNSIDERIGFAGGVRITINRYDLPGGTEFAWQSQSFVYDSTGNILTNFSVYNDNGTRQFTNYSNGVRTREVHIDADGDTYDLIYDASGALIRTISTDVSNSSPGFYSFTNDFFSGHLVAQTTVLDNGTRTVTSYSPVTGLKTGYQQFDDAHINPNYASLSIAYAADGATVAKTVYTLDDNGTNQFAGAAGATLYGTNYHDSFRGAAGVSDTFLTGPNGGNDYIANFENGLDKVDLAAFGFTSFAQVDAIATGGTGWTYLSFADGGHLMIAGLSRSSLDASDVIL